MEPEPVNEAEGVTPEVEDEGEAVIFPDGQCIACQQTFGEQDQATPRCKPVNNIHNFRHSNADSDAHLQECGKLKFFARVQHTGIPSNHKHVKSGTIKSITYFIHITQTQ